ncbi:hypothetical protein CEE37_09755 [candidate division LCP-89 bacterium B3_LCP]|uniref:PDGLE domain-containing protein n=1 Tax=candidate division LCP-89 bacterium B3_LCP TaxID=2012998 RepID=A0A532UYI8_UNCL8|nr:MAG: hypothetical protein CEE37_09755 [candidate division LCP-89 bacterium B3_LCP]
MKRVLPFLVIALAIAGLISPFASSFPDGLERVAGDHHCDSLEVEPCVDSPFPDYSVPALGQSRWSTGIAGLVGTLICFGVPFILYFFQRK